MSVVFACIAPHGAQAIPELAGDMFEAYAETRRGMERLAEEMRQKRPDTVVLATPHNVRLEGMIGIVTAEFAEGKLEANNSTVSLRCRCDRALANLILRNAKKLRLPVIGVNYVAGEGDASCMPMDWGTLIPLWFLARQNNNGPSVVLVTPSREIPLQSLVRFGRIIAEAAEPSHRRIAFVASADQGHAHDPKGPYGFHVASAKYDEKVKKAVLTNDLAPLLSLAPQFIDDAKPDSIWQLAILQGVLEHTQMAGRLLSYQVPTYFGLLCAVYLPKRKV